MLDDKIREIQCVRISEKSRIEKREIIATESAMDLYIDEKIETSFSYTIGLEDQLVLGYLISSGIIKSQSEISSMKFIDSSCRISLFRRAKNNLEESLTTISKVLFSQLQEARSNLLRNQQHHNVTRAFHGAILYEIETGNWFSCEDICRHNALDKVIGYCWQNNYSLRDCLLLMTGRLTSKIVAKACSAGIAVIASLTVATDKGIEIARETNTTLIGSLSKAECWLYNEGKTKLILG